MIRDPSDGSVREKQTEAALRVAGELGRLIVDQGAERAGLLPASGLPAGSTKPEQIARLNESRKWLADYHAKKAADGQ